MRLNIRKIRRERDITQEELSEKTGISRATISALEQGSVSNTTANTLVKIADALGVSIRDLFLE